MDSKKKSDKSYASACHAVQTGVMYQIENQPKEAAASPKHLRTGINIAMCDHSGLVALLIEKGVITDDEYMNAITSSINKEVDRYEHNLSEYFNADIGLG